MRNVIYGPIFIAAMLWIFAGSEVGERANIDLNGTIVAADSSCMQPYSYRCGTVYAVEAADGSRQRYTAGPTDKALRRWLPVGTVIVKKRWMLSYSINGHKIDDFPLIFYSVVFTLGLISAIVGCVGYRLPWLKRPA